MSNIVRIICIKFIFLPAFLLINSAGVSGQELPERPSYYGVSPAFPLVNSLPDYLMAPPFLTNEKVLTLTLEIDNKGKAKKCVSPEQSDSLFIKYVFSSLKNVEFMPAEIDNKAVNSELIIRVTINPRFRSTTIIFPIDSSHKVVNENLYWLSIKKLGAMPPSIKIFPSYFCNLKPKDSLQLLPYLQLNLKLDSSGAITQIVEIGNTIGSFAEQVKSAVLWASFEPLRISGRNKSSECYLVVSFLPQIQYPTKRIDYANDTGFVWHERWRIQLLPDTIGIMNVPLPKQIGLDQSGLFGAERYLGGEVSASLTIDSTGKVNLKHTDSNNPAFHKAIVKLTKNSRFFPAINFKGETVSFTGSAKFLFQYSGTVRIEYSWLKN